MKRLNVGALVAFACLFVLLPMAEAQKAKRVRFPRGRTTAILHGKVQGDEVAEFVLKARAGQTMIVHLASQKRGVRFDLFPASERAALVDGGEDVRDWAGALPYSGDYVISVYSTEGAARFTLEITVRDGTE